MKKRSAFKISTVQDCLAITSISTYLCRIDIENIIYNAYYATNLQLLESTEQLWQQQCRISSKQKSNLSVRPQQQQQRRQQQYNVRQPEFCLPNCSLTDFSDSCTQLNPVVITYLNYYYVTIARRLVGPSDQARHIHRLNPHVIYDYKNNNEYNSSATEGLRECGGLINRTVNRSNPTRRRMQPDAALLMSNWGRHNIYYIPCCGRHGPVACRALPLLVVHCSSSRSAVATP